MNAVDEETFKLYKSWLIHVRNEQQAVSKAFQVNLPVGGAKAAKKVSRSFSTKIFKIN